MAENANANSHNQTIARPSTAIRREGSARMSAEPSGPRIAHTLTACCRCRTVSVVTAIALNNVLMLPRSERRDVMSACRDADHASAQIHTANTSIRQKAPEYLEIMSSTCNIKCAFSRINWLHSRKRTSIRIPRMWSGTEWW